MFIEVATREGRIAAIRSLYERPGTPGEKEAARLALERMGVGGTPKNEPIPNHPLPKYEFYDERIHPRLVDGYYLYVVDQRQGYQRYYGPFPKYPGVSIASGYHNRCHADCTIVYYMSANNVWFDRDHGGQHIPDRHAEFPNLE
jgi:hypothetical protein